MQMNAPAAVTACIAIAAFTSLCIFAPPDVVHTVLTTLGIAVTTFCTLGFFYLLATRA